MTKLNATYVYKQFMSSVKKAKEDVEKRLVSLLDRIGKDTTDKVKEYVNLYFLKRSLHLLKVSGD